MQRYLLPLACNNLLGGEHALDPAQIGIRDAGGFAQVHFTFAGFGAEIMCGGSLTTAKRSSLATLDPFRSPTMGFHFGHCILLYGMLGWPAC